MKALTQGRYLGRDGQAALFDVGLGYTLTVRILEGDIGRVTLKPQDGYRLDRGWSIAPGGLEPPYEGRPRDDLSGFTGPKTDIRASADKVVVAGAGLTAEVTLSPFGIAWRRQGEDKPFLQDRATQAYLVSPRTGALAHFMARDDHERHYGLGDKAGPLDRTGRRFAIDAVDPCGFDAELSDPLYKMLPFFIVDGPAGAHGVYYDNLSTGSVDFGRIAAAVEGSGRQLGLIFGLIFILAGLTFKISAVPFHMWTPDVYEGAPSPVTAFFASAPKVAGIAIFVRATITAFPGITHEWQQIVVFVSIASMALGSFAAIGQKNIKRLMAYSSIGHMGFALVGLAAASPEGVQGVLVYMSIYVAMTLGSFAIIMAMRRKDGRQVETIEDLAGLSTTNPFMAVVLTALMFSLAGIPPLAGPGWKTKARTKTSRFPANPRPRRHPGAAAPPAQGSRRRGPPPNRPWRKAAVPAACPQSRSSPRNRSSPR